MLPLPRPSLPRAEPSAPSRQDSRPAADLDALVQPALGGDLGATARLLEGVLPAIRGACRAMLGPRHSDLEDAVQNALVAFHDALPRYRFESSILHYAVRITFRTTHGFRRKLRLLAERFDLLGDRDDLASSDTSSDAERTEALRKLLLKLPRIQAETLLMHFALGFPIAEVAAIESVSVNTVKTRLRLGKDSLRRRVARDPVLRLMIGGEA